MEFRHLDYSLFKIDGWAKILRGAGLFPNKKGYNILIKGLPGTGKTSLGLSILHEVCNKESTKARLVTFVEPANKILELINLFPWNFRNRLDIVETTPSNLDSLGFLEDDALGSEIQYLMIDGISILKYQTEELKPRTKKLIDCLKERRLSTILISEEAVPGEDRFFEYLVDGIINLTVKGSDRQRFLEISKMRYRNYVPGEHSFDFRKCLPPHADKIDIRIYPSIKCYLEDKAVDQGYKSISSSIEGFDRLITGSSKVPFDPGDVVLVMGEPSSGKTVFSLEFINGIQKGENNQEIGVWISLEEDLDEFKKYTKLFSENKKPHFTQLLANEKFKFIYFDPSRFRLDEF
ncbi:MAG: circadian clock protein KaiC, partial [Candidatus Poribacteria bacterium]|nr:circadian clock protein KaiC [Candidatus Poribacteria bacterium]